MAAQVAVAPVDFLVVGAGPCGIVAVANLLQREGLSVGWVERNSFESVGRLGAEYRSVPANTRNDRIASSFRQLDSMEFSKAQQRRDKTLSTADPMGTCDLGLSVDALKDCSEALRRKVAYALDHCEATSFQEQDDVWKVSLRTAGGVQTVEARTVLFVPGSVPKSPPPTLAQALVAKGVQVMGHDDCVVPSRCSALIKSTNLKVAVVGGSHSGILAAMNLAKMKCEVTVFTRRDLLFAEDRGDWIKFDGTGLKARTADFARRASFKVEVTGVETDEGYLDRFEKNGIEVAVFAIGFQREESRLPQVNGSAMPGSYDGRTGRIAKGLYGLGLAYPEVWTDRDGHTEPRVGFAYGFNDHANRAIDHALL